LLNQSGKEVRPALALERPNGVDCARIQDYRPSGIRGNGRDRCSLSKPFGQGRSRGERHRQPSLYDGLKLLVRIGFTEVVVHPSRKTHRPISLRGMSREGNNRNASRTLSLVAANRAGRRIAVHPWHLAIHENQVIGDSRSGLNGLLPSAHTIHSTPQRLQHGERNLVVDWIVFGHQDPATNIRRSHRHVWERTGFWLLCWGLFSDMHTIHRLRTQTHDSLHWRPR